MSLFNRKRSKIKLRVKDKHQNDVFLDVSPDDTFETLQLRAELEIGLTLDLKQFSYCGQRIDPKGNVIEYFRSICKGSDKGTAGGAGTSGEVEQQRESGTSSAQVNSTPPGPGDNISKKSEDKLNSGGDSNAEQGGMPTNSAGVKDGNVNEDSQVNESCMEVCNNETLEDVSTDSDDMMMHVVEDDEIQREESALPMHEVKEEATESCEATVCADVGQDTTVLDEVRTAGDNVCDEHSTTTAVESMEVEAVREFVLVKEEFDDGGVPAQVDGGRDYNAELNGAGVNSLDDSSCDTDSFCDVVDGIDVGQLCRLCGKEKSDMVFIFGEEGMNLCLKEKINSWLPLNVRKTDQFPKQVCENCIVKVTICQEFGMQCMRVHTFLQQLIDENKFRCKTLDGGSGDTDNNWGVEVMNSQVDYDNSVQQDELANKTLCCPLCVTGVMTTKHSDDLKEVEVSSSEEEMESSGTELPTEQDAISVVEEEDKKNYSSATMENSSADHVFFDYDSTSLVETVIDESGDTVLEDQTSGVMTEVVMFPPKRGGQRGRPRGSRGRGLSQGAKVKVEHAQEKSRGRGRGRGRGRAKSIQHGLGAAHSVAVPCCLCNTGVEGVNDAFFHTLLNHSVEPHSYNCSLCGENVTDRNSIIGHFCEAHACKVTAYERFGDKITLLYECEDCSTVFRSEKTLCVHNCDQKFESKSLKCSICNKTFVTKARLYFHQQFHWKKSRPMYCETCNLDFADEDTMYDHFKFSHRGEKYVCSICGTHFNSKTGCDTHEQMHTNKLINKRTFTCDVCSKSFFDKQTLKEHVVSHMETRPYQCHICGRDLSRPSRLKRHLKAHASYNAPPQDIYRCTTCDEVFCNQEKAFEHTQGDVSECRVEDGAEHEFAKESIDKVYRCEFCEKCYSAPGVLNYHRDSHRDDNMPYRCHICGTPHVSFSRCATHKVTHGLFIETDLGDFTVPKYFLCEFCGRYFLHWTYLSVHRRRQHSSIKYMVKGKNVFKPEVPAHNKPFKCDKCGRRYLLDWALAKHIKRHHSGDDSSSYQCDHCGKVFTCKKFLGKHMAVHGEKQFACEFCESTFVRASSLAIHVGRVHTANKQHCCEYCGMEFMRKTDMTEHIRTHTGDRPFECEYCKKTFRTRGIWLQHTRIHRDERPYPCSVCGAAFRRSFALKNHMTLHTGVRAFVCEVCGKDFRMHQELTKHLKMRHPERGEDIKQESVSVESAPSKA